ncbi:hypothetical protein D9757_012231 [Collybiopsis confluens]|uniref:JmjC domain-containing protein n=1 Tax=Collybiopsis confluens TaxID=2823264 RepID=A0A8H5LJL5_9AGAR|nr:hypothetical protein D9757_012231 [Collybiopsis confluens]
MKTYNSSAQKRKRSNTSNDTPSNLATRHSARIEAKKLAGDYQEIFIPVTKSVPQKCAKASPSSEKEEIPEFDIQVYSKLIEGATHTLFNHDGRHSLEYTHFAHDNVSLKHLNTVLNSVNAQAKKDGCLLKNGTFAPGGDDPNEYPISELSSDSWNCLSPQERQAWFGGNKILVTRRSNLPTSYQLGSKSHLQALVGDFGQDGSRHAKKASDTHTHGTLAVMQEVVQSGKKVANCLEIPLLPSTVQYPSGLCTQDVAEAETGHPISHVGKTWGLFASSYALHTSHIDSDGRGTFIQVKVGVKYWIVVVPMSDTDLEQLEAFGEGYDVDMTNSQSWKIYGILLWPGDWLVFPPCTPHFVLTPEAAICHGGHFVSSQTLVRTNYAILQTFVASDLLTNTIDFNAPEGLQLIVQYWSNLIVDNEEDYLEMLKKHDRQIIPDVPNFQLLDDIVAFLSLANIIKLGGVLDVCKYRENSSYSSQPGHSVPKGIRHHAAEVKTQVLDIEDWLFRHFHLVLVSSGESSGASDGLETAERLPTLAVRYFAQQTQALLYHKFTTTPLVLEPPSCGFGGRPLSGQGD